jgi:hypothetical protein
MQSWHDLVLRLWQILLVTTLYSKLSSQNQLPGCFGKDRRLCVVGIQLGLKNLVVPGECSRPLIPHNRILLYARAADKAHSAEHHHISESRHEPSHLIDRGRRGLLCYEICFYRSSQLFSKSVSCSRPKTRDRKPSSEASSSMRPAG